MFAFNKMLKLPLLHNRSMLEQLLLHSSSSTLTILMRVICFIKIFVRSIYLRISAGKGGRTNGLRSKNYIVTVGSKIIRALEITRVKKFTFNAIL